MGVAATPHGQCDKWDAQGLRGHHNYYYQFTDRGTPCEVDGLNYLRTPSQPAAEYAHLAMFGQTTTIHSQILVAPIEKKCRCPGGLHSSTLKGSDGRGGWKTWTHVMDG